MKTSISREKSLNGSKSKGLNYSYNNLNIKKSNKNLSSSKTKLLKKDLISPKTIDYTKSQSIKILNFLVIEKYGKIIDRLTTDKSKENDNYNDQENSDEEYELKIIKKDSKKNNDYDKEKDKHSFFNNSSRILSRDFSSKKYLIYL